VKRRIFLSYQHEDQLKAKGFNLTRYNKGLELEFVTRGLLDPVMSANESYISRQIKDRMKGTSVTVVLLGEKTAGSVWVGNEIRWSTEKNPPNGLLGIKLTPDAAVPDGLEGAEILDWTSLRTSTSSRPLSSGAALIPRRMAQAAAAAGSGSSCGRS
jgi:hypothetical protein